MSLPIQDGKQFAVPDRRLQRRPGMGRCLEDRLHFVHQTRLDHVEHSRVDAAVQLVPRSRQDDQDRWMGRSHAFPRGRRPTPGFAPQTDESNQSVSLGWVQRVSGYRIGRSQLLIQTLGAVGLGDLCQKLGFERRGDSGEVGQPLQKCVHIQRRSSGDHDGVLPLLDVRYCVLGSSQKPTRRPADARVQNVHEVIRMLLPLVIRRFRRSDGHPAIDLTAVRRQDLRADDSCHLVGE